MTTPKRASGMRHALRAKRTLGLTLIASSIMGFGTSRPTYASTCVGARPSNKNFEIVAEVRVLSVDESGTAAKVSVTKQIKGRVSLKVFGIYSYLPTPSPDVDSPLIPPSNTMFMQAGTGLRIRGQWNKHLPSIGKTPARLQVELCSTDQIDPPGPFAVTVSSTSYRVNAGNDATVHATTKILTGTASRPELRIAFGDAPAGVSMQRSATTGDTTDFTFSTALDAPPGVYTLQLVAKSVKLKRTVPIVLRITRNLPGFGVSAQPISTTVIVGASTSPDSNFDVHLTKIGGFADPVSYSIIGLPLEATTAMTDTAAGVSIQVRTTKSTPAGTFPILITARSGARTATIPVSLVVVTELAA
jgi:hypothetical protein